MKLFITPAIALIALLFTLPARAFDGITYYDTVISQQDRYNSYGERLHSVRAILRQDRANVHLFGKAEPGDGYERFFSHNRNRNMFNSARLRISPSLARRIKHGPPVHVRVYVYPGEIEVTR